MKAIRAFQITMLLATAWLLPDAAIGAAPQAYMYLVFSNPNEGAEDEYNRWYDAQHIPDVLSVPGFVSAERFRLNDIQMYPGGKAAMPLYLVSYVIRTDDIDAVMKEVGRRLQAGETVISPAFDRKTSLAYLYRATRTFKRTTPDPTRGIRGTRTDYLHVVFTYPRLDRIDRFDPWYDDVHAPGMMRGPGYVSAQRGVLAQPVKFASIQPSDAIAVFRLTLPSGMPIDRAREVPAAGSVPASEILDLSRNRGYSYRLIHRRVMAAPIQAARARAKAAAKRATVAFNQRPSEPCGAFFGRIAARPAGIEAQDRLVDEAEESGCLE
jgi:hypothetical protein